MREHPNYKAVQVFLNQIPAVTTRIAGTERLDGTKVSDGYAAAWSSRDGKVGFTAVSRDNGRFEAMTITVDVYKSNLKLGSGTATANSRSITSFTVSSGLVVGPGRNVPVTPTSGNNIGATMATRAITDGGTSLTLKDPVPFS